MIAHTKYFFIKLVTVISLIFLGTEGCNDDEIFPIDYLFGFEFKLKDELGTPFTFFHEGENIIFSFQIINNSNQEIFFKSMDTEEFMKVYKLDTVANLSIPVGKPYKDVFCDNQTGILIAPTDTLKLEIPWSYEVWAPGVPYYNPNFCSESINTFLTAGRYKTGFSSQFHFLVNGVEQTTNLNDFHIIFDVDFCERDFLNKQLDGIRSCIKGNWKLFLEEGGLGGVYNVYDNAFMEFKMGAKADSIIWIKGDWVERLQIEWIYDKDEFNRRADFIIGPGFLIVELRNDTLKLQDYGSEPFTYYLSRTN